MTQVQVASTGNATIAIGVSGAPYIMVRNVTQAGSYDLVAFAYSYTRLVNLLEVGYAIVDPTHIATCGCGALIGLYAGECESCAAKWDDWLDDGQMYRELAVGG